MLRQLINRWRWSALFCTTGGSDDVVVDDDGDDIQGRCSLI